MLNKYTFLDLAEEVLKASEAPLDVSKMWEEAISKKAADKLDSKGKTPSRSLGSRLYVDTKDNKKSRFFRVGRNPILFGLKAKHTAQKIQDFSVTSVQPSQKFKERDLHPLLAFFAKYYLDKVYVKTIYHEKSTKKSFNEWLHLDLVGVRFPDLHVDVFSLAKVAGDLPFQLLSFELKRNLDFSNLRESFFQAVSNSSWAHQGYLVAANINDSLDFLGELKRLSGSFGIGVISLNVENVDDSFVLCPAEERKMLDWDSVNKLAKENSDFSGFLHDVITDLNGKKVHPTEYDKVEEDVEKLKLLS